MAEPATGRRPTGPAPALRRGWPCCGWSPSDLARSRRHDRPELGLARSTVYELLGELAAAGFVTHLAADRTWGLGVASFEIGTAYLRAEPLGRLGRPVLARLARAAGGTAHLGVLHGAETLYLVKERPPSVGPTLVTEVGVRLPAALTATGLSILAALPPAQVRALFPDAAAFVLRTGRGPATPGRLRSELAAVRARGWALEDGRISPDTATVAAVVLDHNGRSAAAIGVHGAAPVRRGRSGPGMPARAGWALRTGARGGGGTDGGDRRPPPAAVGPQERASPATAAGRRDQAGIGPATWFRPACLAR